jgi:hypothetical protein
MRSGFAPKDLAQTYTGQGRKQEAQAQKEIVQTIRKDSSDRAADAPDPSKFFQTRPPQGWQRSLVGDDA